MMMAGALGCGSEKPAPDQPTWADDVRPILQANCFQCHGPAADYAKWGTNRWDVYDLTDPNYAMLGFGEVVLPSSVPDEAGLRTFVSARDTKHFGTIPAYTSPDAPEGARMPPLPATRLSARDFTVLQNWAKTGFTPGQHQPNHKPVIEWLDPGKSFAVTDEDSDQVLGSLVCGGTTVRIEYAGAHDLPPGTAAPCSGMLYDGFGELTPAELK
ncbi:MAG TPA: hypothetical protein VN914_15495 [Polyangia bacterium]|nr:hypothetical protein [Polyangia bacterium]